MSIQKMIDVDSPVRVMSGNPEGKGGYYLPVEGKLPAMKEQNVTHLVTSAEFCIVQIVRFGRPVMVPFEVDGFLALQISAPSQLLYDMMALGGQYLVPARLPGVKQLFHYQDVGIGGFHQAAECEHRGQGEVVTYVEVTCG